MSGNRYQDELPILTLTPDQCWTRIRSSRVGRIGVIADGAIEMFPVNFVVDGRAIVFATSSRVLLAALEQGRTAAFEADGVDGWTAWSVLARGPLQRLEADAVVPERLWSMLPGEKDASVRIVPTSISGRLFDEQPPPPHGAPPGIATD